MTSVPPFESTATRYVLMLRVEAEGDHEIRKLLTEHGFVYHQDGIYFGGPQVTAASATLAVIDVTARLPWFAACVRDIRMLRIEEANDLMPIVQRIAGL